MKDLRPRGSAPVPLSDLARDQRREWYVQLRNASGRIRERWGDPAVRAAVAEITGGCCTWCGVRLDRGWPVDHFLPSSKFPHLAYCWTNLLPSCPCCNTSRKGSFAPPALAADRMIDPVLDLREGDRHYIPDQVLPSLTDRLIDPTFDDPEVHLRFEAALHGYSPCTPAGTTTCKKLFVERDYAEGLEKLSDKVRDEVNRASAPADLKAGLDLLDRLVGRRFYIDAYARFWQSILRPEWPREDTSASSMSTGP